MSKPNKSFWQAGTTYVHEQIQNHVADDDLQNIAEWFEPYQEGLQFTFQYLPMSQFASQAKEMIESLPEFPDDKRRINKIKKLLKEGQPSFPVFVDAQDPDLFVLEGRHRLCALFQLNHALVPVLLVNTNAGIPALDHPEKAFFGG